MSSSNAPLYVSLLIPPFGDEGVADPQRTSAYMDATVQALTQTHGVARIGLSVSICCARQSFGRFSNTEQRTR